MLLPARIFAHTFILSVMFSVAGFAQDSAPAASKPGLPPLPAPLDVPKPGPVTGGPYAPQAILQGGIVVTLFPPDSHYLNTNRIKEAEVYHMSHDVPGRIQSIVNIHNPSIEVHLVERSLNTGAAIIVAAGGGHKSLNVGGESADFVPFFYNYGVNTIILRNRLRRDGYNAQTDEVYDAQQAIRMVRAHAKDWRIDPDKIGIMGFSAGAELSAPCALFYPTFDETNSDHGDPLAGVSSRPDFVGIIYPGPTPFSRDPQTPIPTNCPPAFIVCGGSGDPQHALWADDYFAAMLRARIPDVEMHIYGRGRHPGDDMGNGAHMSGGLTDRNNFPYGTWQFRFIDWFRDLGFLQKPGTETQSAKDIANYRPPEPHAKGTSH
jgi:acetyl esterase/lipase